MTASEDKSFNPVRIYFLGSGAIGVPALSALLAAPEIVVVGIGTQPDRPSGRRRVLTPTAVGELAAARNLAADKPGGVNRPEFRQRIAELKPEIIVVAAFGQLLKTELLTDTPFGCFNVHASLLPRHRGASPVVATVLSGDRESGVTFMQMDEHLDTGPVYQRFPIPLADGETTASLEEKLGRLAATHIVTGLVSVCRKKLEPIPQDNRAATYAPKISKQDGRIDWMESAVMIERKVRAYCPWPRAFFSLTTGLGKRRILVNAATVVPMPFDGGDLPRPGTVLQADKHAWIVACGDGALELQQIVPEGKHEMAAADFLRGANVAPGMNLADTGYNQSNNQDLEKKHETTTDQQ